ncbi:MAG: DUF2511 domain-containing protein [Merismopedia sp. SIO2A8]|nr:DUF2511 domain-containing protein [Symploca sp. SIO2B6]NET51295.1 DUF2511 domain-containing protein [Merismopedia sp. SIO2A8]
MIKPFSPYVLSFVLLIGAGITVGACTRNPSLSTAPDAANAAASDASLLANDTGHASASTTKEFNPFRDAVELAIEAAELNEIAETSQDWRDVAEKWRRAIELMKAVPETHEKYDIAQQRALEAYPQNLAYAQGRAGEDALPEYTTDDDQLTKVDFGEGWPFVVDGQIKCERINAGEYVVDLVTMDSLDRVYAVNLPAQSRAKERNWQKIDEIWRDSPLGDGKVPINWVIWRGESLCDAPLEGNRTEG